MPITGRGFSKPGPYHSAHPSIWYCYFSIYVQNALYEAIKEGTVVNESAIINEMEWAGSGTKNPASQGKIDEYNNDFDGQFLPVTPIVNKNSQNSFTINFTAQNKQVTYDFDEMYNKLVNFKDNYDLESDMAKELGLYEFVTSIEDELYTERDKAIDFSKEDYYR